MLSSSRLPLFPLLFGLVGCLALSSCPAPTNDDDDSSAQSDDDDDDSLAYRSDKSPNATSPDQGRVLGAGIGAGSASGCRARVGTSPASSRSSSSRPS